MLLIEDEPTSAKSIELVLGTEGFNVYTTVLGEERLDLGKLYDYDIILLDLNLPDMQATTCSRSCGPPRSTEWDWSRSILAPERYVHPKAQLHDTVEILSV